MFPDEAAIATEFLMTDNPNLHSVFPQHHASFLPADRQGSLFVKEVAARRLRREVTAFDPKPGQVFLITATAAEVSARRGRADPRPKGARAAPAEFRLGDDKAYTVTVEGKTFFTIGGEIQTAEDFERQIAQRFAGTFRQTWDEALRIMQAHPRAVLESQSDFYAQVYRPRRDELARRWTERAGAGSASPSSRS